MTCGPRRTGRTTRQILDAPKGALFIWCNGQADYPVHLARFLGRDDLVMKSPQWLTGQNGRGDVYPAIVVDHAAEFSEEESRALRRLQTWCRSHDWTPKRPHPTRERWDHTGLDPAIEHRPAMNSPMKPPMPRVTDDECQCVACQAATGGEVFAPVNLPRMGEQLPTIQKWSDGDYEEFKAALDRSDKTAKFSVVPSDEISMIDTPFGK